MNTMRKSLRLGMASMIVGLFGCALLFAQAGSGSKESDTKTAVDMQNLNLEGELVAARAGSDSKEAAPIAFKISKATDTSGKEIANLKGKVLDFAQTGKGKELLKAHHQGDRLVLKANLVKNKIEVASFKKAGAGSESKMEKGSGSK